MYTKIKEVMTTVRIVLGCLITLIAILRWTRRVGQDPDGPRASPSETGNVRIGSLDAFLVLTIIILLVSTTHGGAGDLLRRSMTAGGGDLWISAALESVMARDRQNDLRRVSVSTDHGGSRAEQNGPVNWSSTPTTHQPATAG